MAALHPQIQSLLDLWAQRDGDPDAPADLAALRAGYLQTALELGGAAETVAAVEDVVVPRDDARIAARIYRPSVPAEQAPGAIIWLHGGGWVMGDLDGFDRVCRSLCNAAGHVVASVDYRLAPECPFPAAVHDADAALRWARGAGAEQLACAPDRVLVGGDSAGGNLAAVAALHSRHDDLPALRGQLLVYPALDAAMGSDAYREFADGTGLSAREMEQCWQAYLGEAAGSDPDASPLQADLTGAPPAAIAVAGADPLRDDGLRYAEALRAAGVPAETVVFEDMIHGFLRWGGVVDRTAELIGWLAERARTALP